MKWGKFEVNLGKDNGYSDKIQDRKAFQESRDYMYIKGGELKVKDFQENWDKWTILVDENKLGYFVFSDNTVEDSILEKLIDDARILCDKLVLGEISHSEVENQIQKLTDDLRKSLEDEAEEPSELERRYHSTTKSRSRSKSPTKKTNADLMTQLADYEKDKSDNKLIDIPKDHELKNDVTKSLQ